MIRVIKDNKRLIKYLGIIFIAVLLTYRLPHDSYSLMQYILKPIRNGNSVFNFSGIVPLILFYIGIREILYLERFKNKNKVFMFLLIVFILIPVMKWSLDFTRTNYHWIMRDGLNAVDITDSNIELNGTDEDLTINFKFKIIDYSRSQNKFRVRVYLPKAFKDYCGKEYLESENTYRTYGNRSVTNVQEQIIIKLKNDYTRNDLFDAAWYWEDYQYEIYNDNEAVKIIEHGLK